MGLILQIMLFVYLAQAWNIAGGFAGLFSLGHSAFFGLGAYSYAIGVAKYGLDPTVCFLIGGLLAAGLGVVTAIISTRLSGMFFAMVTLGLNEILLNLASQLTWLTNGDAGTYLRKQFTVSAGTAYYLFLVLCIVIFVLAALVCHFSTEPLTPNAAVCPLEAATSVRSSSDFDPVMRTSLSATSTRCARA